MVVKEAFMFIAGQNPINPFLLKRACPKPQPVQYDLSHKTRDQWEIARNELSLTEKLGSGNFGDVWHGWLLHIQELFNSFDTRWLNK